MKATIAIQLDRSDGTDDILMIRARYLLAAFPEAFKDDGYHDALMAACFGRMLPSDILILARGDPWSVIDRKKIGGRVHVWQPGCVNGCRCRTCSVMKADDAAALAVGDISRILKSDKPNHGPLGWTAVDPDEYVTGTFNAALRIWQSGEVLPALGFLVRIFPGYADAWKSGRAGSALFDKIEEAHEAGYETVPPSRTDALRLIVGMFRYCRCMIFKLRGRPS